jgi:hypothetical protein
MGANCLEWVAPGCSNLHYHPMRPVVLLSWNAGLHMFCLGTCGWQVQLLYLSGQLAVPYVCTMLFMAEVPTMLRPCLHVHIRYCSQQVAPFISMARFFCTMDGRCNKRR